VRRLETGTEHVAPATVARVTRDTGTPATSVVPPRCSGAVNIRFNDAHSGDSLSTWLRDQAQDVAAAFGVAIDVTFKISGESFLTPPGPLSTLVAQAVAAETGVDPVLSTTGGTSDARFIKNHCPVVEFGLVGKTMHQIDEHVPVAQIRQLKAVYRRVLADYFA